MPLATWRFEITLGFPDSELALDRRKPAGSPCPRARQKRQSLGRKTRRPYVTYHIPTTRATPSRLKSFFSRHPHPPRLRHSGVTRRGPLHATPVPLLCRLRQKRAKTVRPFRFSKSVHRPVFLLKLRFDLGVAALVERVKVGVIERVRGVDALRGVVHQHLL